MNSTSDIIEPYKFTEEENSLIKSIRETPGFTHTDWGSARLLDLRRNIRKHYRKKQKGLCAFCKEPLSLHSSQNCNIEHLLHKSGYLDFIFEPKNLCLLCADCNEIKRAQEIINEVPKFTKGAAKKYPRTAERFLAYHPHFDKWDENIIKFHKAYIDRTKKGSYTIYICNLNRFFHHFEIDDEYINDGELTDLMNNYINEVDSIKKSRILNNIRSMLNNFE
jgi:uncharacterized protein (TIGR02646 family)